MSIEEAWRAFAKEQNLPDTLEMRLACYFGARHTLDRVIEADPADDDVLMLLNDDIVQFEFANLKLERKGKMNS